MTMKPSPLHFNPLRPSRNQLETITWGPGQPAQRATASSPFAYLHQPYIADSSDEAAYGPSPYTGSYNRATQRWEFPEDAPQMGHYTKTNTTPKSPPTGNQGENPAGDRFDTVTDDACM